MRKYEILYDWPISEVNRLSNSDEAENFALRLSEEAQDGFVRVTEQMRGLGVDLARAKAHHEHFDNWGELRICIDNFEVLFSEFPGFVPEKFKLFVLLADQLAQSGSDIDAANIDEQLFEIRELEGHLPLHWFAKENSASFSDSLVVFSFADISALENEMPNFNLSPRLNYHFLAVLYSVQDAFESHAAMVKREEPQIESSAVDAFVRLAVLASGRPVHLPRNYTSAPCVVDLDRIRAGVEYQQLNEVFYVLSEYNSREEVLTKYLTLYHVIENFMFKLPIVELERQLGGRMFSIRDFQRLYRQVDGSELTALKRLFSSVISLEVTPGTTYKQRIELKWDSLVPRVEEADIDHSMGMLDLKKDRRAMRYNEFKNGDLASNFAQMVYAVRNAIVHNKETEFHLTYATLDNTLCVLIETFLIPSLEEICFGLIESPNQCVWYSNRNLLLYS